MKVRLKLTLDELKALFAILAAILNTESKDMRQHIEALECQILCRKLMPLFFDPPKKHYSVTLNSAQILALSSHELLILGRFEKVVHEDICAKIDKQYISEAHRRNCLIQAHNGKSYITLPE